ncbi:MAG: PEP-CTERM sorting domain-containing protein [Microcystis sp. LE18-22.4A]|jgi:hypothetical protein|nr:PEP-CTERM sorting domain-containing protein [Microcystis sp. LE18-22.4A]MCZ8120366.1 PEP-CTERM sorting domain-containing protein [Microcystis sp. LE18-22.4A]
MLLNLIQKGLYLSSLFAVSLFLPIKAVGQITGITFNQANFDLDSDITTNSNWGQTDLSFIGSSDFQYFNLVVNGNWLIQDDPLLSIEGSGISQTLTFNFDLGNTIGNDVSSLDYIASLTSTPLGMQPSGTPLTSSVGDVDIITGGCLSGIAPLPLTVPQPIIGGTPVNWAYHPGMVNQDVGKNECAPGAFSNSLKWLDIENKIPETLKSIEGLKQILMTTPDGTAVPAWSKKRDALKDYVTTKYFGPGDGLFIMNDANIIDQIIAEIKHGEDVEIWGEGHAAVLTCVIKFADGRAQLCITHDTKQGMPGGTITEKAIYNPITGQFDTAATFMPVGSTIRGFISESKIPEPSTVTGLLGLGILGAGATLKRKVKRSHSTEKEPTNVG